MMENKVIIFDLNGVFILSEHLSKRFEQEYNIPKDTFVQALNHVLEEAREPESRPIFELFKPYLKEWNIGITEIEFLNFWFSGEKVNLEMIQLAKELKQKGYKLVILSNNFKERTEFYMRNFKQDLFDLFDKVYFSWQTGYIKPNPACYTRIFRDLKVEPRDCYYFDDSQTNIETGRSMGINSFVFQKPDDVKKFFLN